ncbi:DJ-1/PfpI family protein [Streptomyces sp. 6N223]|uniref:DJ-1/PfpI family protein n=1 Tax=Streptomyces sp. 6N223 TaxID=3457412 RepID=UPI003FD19B93
MERRDFLRRTTAAGVGAVAAGTLAGTAQADGPSGTAGEAPAADDGPFRVHIVVFDGAEELDFVAPYEVFSGAKWFTSRTVEVRYVTTGRPRLVQGHYGSLTRVDHRWQPEAADIIVVPGGGYTHRDGPGIWAEMEAGVLPRALAEASRPGLTIASVCTGAIVLSAAGLTQGRPCTTHHGAAAYLEEQGGILKNARVVDDGDLVTAGGITSGLELGLWLVRRELGADAALGLEDMLEYQARGTVWVA